MGRAPQYPGRLQPIHLGHLHVHQDRGVPPAGSQLHRLDPIRGNLDFQSQCPQHLLGDKLIGFVVFGQQHPLTRKQRPRLGGRICPSTAGQLQRLGDRSEQGRRGDGLGQKDIHSCRDRLALLVPACVGAGQEEGDPPGRRVRANPPGRFDPVHSRQHPVEHHQAEWIGVAWPGGICGDQFLQSPLGGRHRRGAKRELPEVCSHQLATAVAVLHHQRAQTTQLVGNLVARVAMGGRDPDLGGEGERRASARRAFNRQIAPHQPGQSPADRQSQPCPPKLPTGRTVGLRERLEQPALLLGRHANARIADGELQQHDRFSSVGVVGIRQASHRRSPRARSDCHTQGDFSALGELEGIADQVGQHLPNAQRISHDMLGNVGGGVHHQFHMLLGDPRAEGLGDLLQQTGKMKGN